MRFYIMAISYVYGNTSAPVSAYTAMLRKAQRAPNSDVFVFILTSPFAVGILPLILG